MVCGMDLRRHYSVRKYLAVAGVTAVVAIAAVVLAYLLFPVFFGPEIVTSTDNVRFTVTLADGTAAVEYSGTDDGRDVAELQIAVLMEGGRSSKLYSLADPQQGAEPVVFEIGDEGTPVGVYYVVLYTDGTEINNAISI